MFWVFMMLAFFKFDGNLGGSRYSAQDGFTGIPPNSAIHATDGFTGIPPTTTTSYKAMDGFTGIPPK